MSELYIEKGGKKLRCGYTTGSCAAAASKAALIMLLDGTEVRNVKIITPKGIEYVAEIEDITRDEAARAVSCAVVKDGGDDPDATNGMKIYATVTIAETAADGESADFQADGENVVEIDGGEGIGRVTRPGLDQPIGEAAINSVPRKMITEAVMEVLKERNLSGLKVSIVISAPEGQVVAEKTFNPKLGIVGGISILGTTGIVEPMSDEAILATIKAEISIRKAEGNKVLLMAPGNYGLKFLADTYGVLEDMAVMCSNFVYDTLEYAREAGFKEVLFVGHLGKLVKVAGGVKNTHSAYGDRRMEILAEATRSLLPEGDGPILDDILSCVMTDEAVRIITEAGLKEPVFSEIARRIKGCMEDWMDGQVKVETIVFSNDYTKLVETDGAADMMERLKSAAD
ncbi:cobalt-precorrin-5B (C(1))-methyltransferase CbiD [Butyrivibrio sp. CB08]|uniref:cobalt-precorrin-5B (C(1))-methyltransferase CbiD n=1 Tax=Butyrivibrio sp. CB08 TaxID=2364879 RepID=UPI001FAA9983|nr:cobalt-precorrin-5B (C(1))-methyltransferase CbiD [Butyrivibrio sp. CB08]